MERPEVTGAGGRNRFRPRVLVAAAAAVIALGAGTAVVQPWDDDTAQIQPTALERVKGAPDSETFTETLNSGAKTTVVRSRSLNEAVLVTADLPEAPSGSTYELWLIHDGEMVSAGLMADVNDEIVLDGDPASAQGFGITLEDDDNPEPSFPPISKIDFQTA